MHALAIIRGYWMKINSSVGSPPILVLSYKNHATDEFLVDLLKVVGTSLSGASKYGKRFGQFAGGNSQLVRMGNPGDPSLVQYSERALAHRADPSVGIREREVQDLQDLPRACQRAQKSGSLFRSYHSDMFDNTGSNQSSTKNQQKAAAYEATEILFAAIVRNYFLETIVFKEPDLTGDDLFKALLDISSILNKDNADDPKFQDLQKRGKHSMLMNDVYREYPPEPFLVVTRPIIA